jgi:hypothetical protein
VHCKGLPANQRVRLVLILLIRVSRLSNSLIVMEALQEACELALEAGEASSSSNPNPKIDKKKKRKRTLNEVIADIPDPSTVVFDPHAAK